MRHSEESIRQMREKSIKELIDNYYEYLSTVQKGLERIEETLRKELENKPFLGGRYYSFFGGFIKINEKYRKIKPLKRAEFEVIGESINNHERTLKGIQQSVEQIRVTMKEGESVNTITFKPEAETHDSMVKRLTSARRDLEKLEKAWG